jgi:ABC-type bacteriocin/lantibiotic exporter with double-glycine peptidase domain
MTGGGGDVVDWGGAQASTASIAKRPANPRGVSDLLRMLAYLKPYRVRWIAMIVIGLVSLVATVAIPLMTKAVIDGPVAHRDPHGLWVLGSAATAVGITEALLWFIRRWRPTSARSSTGGCRFCRCPSTDAGSPASCCRES